MKTSARVILGVAALFLTLYGCDDRRTPGAAGTTAETSKNADAKVTRKPRHRENDHKVVVLTGPEFASKQEILDALISEYGLDGLGGMVVPMQYPESFMDGKKMVMSKLSEAVAAPGVTTLVTVGAPEGVVRELLKIRAHFPDLRIASLFTQDEMLQVELASDLTLEYAPAGDILADENATAMPAADVDALILAATLALEDPDKSIAPLQRLQTSLDAARGFLKRKTAGSAWKIDAWLDPDTNLRSRVRLVLSDGGGST
ncbi:MAG TPA: DUF3798 domain-containing protein [Treponemataceae bacterium]|nr:DUF3798 domain-containing protein [Treponemataceae bacterium]